jgi:hypothetical protein
MSKFRTFLVQTMNGYRTAAFIAVPVLVVLVAMIGIGMYVEMTTACPVGYLSDGRASDVHDQSCGGYTKRHERCRSQWTGFSPREITFTWIENPCRGAPCHWLRTKTYYRPGKIYRIISNEHTWCIRQTVCVCMDSAGTEIWTSGWIEPYADESMCAY